MENIASYMCFFQFDKLFENGLISVDSKEIVICKQPDEQHQPIKTHVQQVLGTNCVTFNKKNEKY